MINLSNNFAIRKYDTLDNLFKLIVYHNLVILIRIKQMRRCLHTKKKKKILEKIPLNDTKPMYQKLNK